MFAVGGAASLRRYNHPMSASIPPARRELTQLSATETNALPEDLLRAILSYVSRSGVRELTVLPGRLYGLDASATAVGNGQRSLKSILRPLRSRVIKCPDDIPLLEDAVAAAGTKCDAKRDVVLLTKSVVLQAPIVLRRKNRSKIKLTIVVAFDKQPTHGADPTVYLSRPRIAEEEEDEEEETWPPRMCISNLGRVELPQARARELEYLVPDDCVGDMVCWFDSPPDTSAVSPLRITNVRTDGEGNRYVLA